MAIEIEIKISNYKSNLNPNEYLKNENRIEEPKLHPKYQLLRELSKRGILDDQLMIKLEFF